MADEKFPCAMLKHRFFSTANTSVKFQYKQVGCPLLYFGQSDDLIGAVEIARCKVTK